MVVVHTRAADVGKPRYVSMSRQCSLLAAEGDAADARSHMIAVPPLPILEPDMDVPRRARPKIVQTNSGELIHRLRARFKASATGSGARAKQGRSRPR